MTPCRSTKLGLFRGHEGGNAAMMFGLALVPLVGFIGAALDYSRASDFQTKLHQAADAAALIAAKDRNSPWAKRKANAEKVFQSALGGHDGMNDVWVTLREIDNGVRVEAGGEVVNRIMAAVGLTRTSVKRVLSPEPPFTEAAPYDPKHKKYLVLMTDGLNSFVANN